MVDGSALAPGCSLTFLGGAGTVTGSRFLLDTGRARVLIDCGLFQGLKELRLRNWEPFPIDPSSIDAVVVTHAHIDHIGFVPRLVRQGFSGSIHCSRSTADLAAIVLPDSGHLQEEEAAFANRIGSSRHRPALPLYTEADARAALAQLDPLPFGEATAVVDGVTITLQPAGHILGSATVTVDLDDHGRRLVFSGDLGRPDHPLLEPPAAPDDPDIIVVESTYGGRRHDEAGAIEAFGDVITRTAQRGGTVVIPAFAVDRTEVVLYRLKALMDSGVVPQLPVYVDSPMALRALEVYRRAIRSRSPEIHADLSGALDPFDTGQLHEVMHVEDSKALATAPHPSIIVSASGMATGGRVIHHLARLLPDSRNAVILVGFQAAGTRGRRLRDGQSELKMFGRYVRVRAEVADIGAFSVHADHDELMGWLRSSTKPPESVFVVHGEAEGAAALCDAIRAELDWSAVSPHHGERVLLA